MRWTPAARRRWLCRKNLRSLAGHTWFADFLTFGMVRIIYLSNRITFGCVLSRRARVFKPSCSGNWNPLSESYPSPDACAGGMAMWNSCGRCTGWCCFLAKPSSTRNCWACAPAATRAGTAFCIPRPSISISRAITRTTWKSAATSFPISSGAARASRKKCFPPRGGDGRLLPRFIAVANIASRDPAVVRHGNERVIRPRLADAAFFWRRDRETPLRARLRGLKEVVFQKELGTLHEKTQRVSKLAAGIAGHIGADAARVKRAAELSRCDLLTQMVGEFPELQGIMGRHYAALDGEPAEVCAAIDEMYRPRFAGDALPETAAGQALALADKLDTLAGLFGIGQAPTGDRDPLGLRRAALGFIRIIVERRLPLPLRELLSAGFESYGGRIKDARADLEAFIFDRFAGYLKDRGFTTLPVEAVLCQEPQRLDLVPRQLEAVQAFQALPEAESLSAANKRVANILRQAEAKGEKFKAANPKHLKEPAERALYDALDHTYQKARALFDRGDYAGYLRSFAALKAPVDAFFDSVMVMAEDPALRRNRLALLAELRLKMNRVADISKLAS